MKRPGLFLFCAVVAFALTLTAPPHLGAAETGTPFDLRVKTWADQCAAEIVGQYNLLLTSGRLTVAQLFDTLYIPVPGSDPQKYRTQYDTLSDGVIRPILDKYLALDKNLVFVVAVDRNGYLPSHNSKYSQPLTGDGDHDTKWNRTKRLFNDRTGLAAARNKEPFLLQRYSRDTGETMSDMSVPIIVQGRHWGALRIGYKAP